MRKISIYNIEDQPLGVGGMGRILKGYDPQGRIVAIKEILPEFASDEEMKWRNGREVEILNSLDHPAIVKSYATFRENDCFYIVMELVSGLNVDQFIKKNGPMSPENAGLLMIKMLDAMQYVHEQGIIHRDIKPSNIMIRDNGEISILDFGIAKDIRDNNGTKTQMGTIIGSDGYMSPEQAQGYNLDHRSDIYSLGCVLFYMLTANHAYKKLGSNAETEFSIVDNPFPPLSKYLHHVPAALQNVLNRATDKNMMKRYQSCREFSKDLRQAVLPNTVVNEPEYLLTLGRENCDINFYDSECRVSRHHANIEMKEFTGGRYFIYTDCSSNGSIVDGKLIKRQSVNIRMDKPLPDIYLAGLNNQKLDWKEVDRLMKEKNVQETVTDEDKPEPVHVVPSQPTDSDESSDEDRSISDEGAMWVTVVVTLWSFLSPLVGWIVGYNVKKKTPKRAKLYIWTSNISFLIGIIVRAVIH